MCLLLFSFRMHPRYPLVLAANRDEDYDRTSAPAAFWSDAPNLLAGRDLREGGTWFGITKKGRIAALTNYRDPASVKDDVPSRGWLVSDFLRGREEPLTYLQNLAFRADQYNSFSLISGDLSHLYYFSNRDGMFELSPGLYGLSNHLLDTPWPKVEQGKEALRSLLFREQGPSPEEIFNILTDRSMPDDESLPDTGVGLEWERILSPIFISSPTYGTRSSLVLMIDRKGHVTFIERIFNAHPDPFMTARFEFRIVSP
ncbi:MAG: NRDE family protein [Syntrophales bacterium]|nr:NRDE family protein [Syntrophales bacterium]